LHLYEKEFVSLSQEIFPIELKDDFKKNLYVVKVNSNIYFMRKINNVINKIKDYYYISLNGYVYSEFYGGLLKPLINSYGYIYYSLSFKDTFPKKRNKYTAHRLVSLLFNYNKNHENLTVNHMNGIKKDNHITNLEWCTSAENFQHALDTGLYDPKEMDKGYARSLSVTQVKRICELIEEGERNHFISEITDIPVYKINDIRLRKTYTHISKSYNLKKATNDFNSISLRDQKEIIRVLKNKENGYNDYSFNSIAKKFNISVQTLRKLRGTI